MYSPFRHYLRPRWWTSWYQRFKVSALQSYRKRSQSVHGFSLRSCSNPADEAFSSKVVKRELENSGSAMPSRESTPRLPEGSVVDPLKLDLGADELDMKSEVPVEPLVRRFGS